MKLPIPIFCNDSIYPEVEFRKPYPDIIAETQKTMNKSQYAAINTFVIGCITKLISDKGDEIENGLQIKQIAKYLPYKSAEYLAIQIMVEYNGHDGVEGMYFCPRCGKKIICEEGTDYDNRDFISDCKVSIMENNESMIAYSFIDPVVIKNNANGETLEIVKSIRMRYPTITDCINAESKHGMENSAKTQIGILSESLLSVNDNDIDNKYRNRYGMIIFGKMPNMKEDYCTIQEKIMEYGLDPNIVKHCPDCGKEWKTAINTSGFFDSALRLVSE